MGEIHPAPLNRRRGQNAGGHRRAFLLTQGGEADAADAPRASPGGAASCERSNVAGAVQGGIVWGGRARRPRQHRPACTESRRTPAFEHGPHGYAHARSQPARVTQPRVHTRPHCSCVRRGRMRKLARSTHPSHAAWIECPRWCTGPPHGQTRVETDGRHLARHNSSHGWPASGRRAS